MSHVQWIDEAPPGMFLRSARVLGAAKNMSSVMSAWESSNRQLIALLYESRSALGVGLFVGGPRGIVRAIAPQLSRPVVLAVGAALLEVWARMESDRSALPALVAWETDEEIPDMVAMTIDPHAFDSSLS